MDSQSEVTLEYLWNISDQEVESLLCGSGLSKSRSSVVGLYKTKLTEADFEKFLLTDHYHSALYKMNYTSLERIWGLSYDEAMEILQYLGFNGHQQLENWKIFLAKEYHKRRKVD
jgi:hypothetical protein